MESLYVCAAVTTQHRSRRMQGDLWLTAVCQCVPRLPSALSTAEGCRKMGWALAACNYMHGMGGPTASTHSPGKS